MILYGVEIVPGEGIPRWETIGNKVVAIIPHDKDTQFLKVLEIFSDLVISDLDVNLTYLTRAIPIDNVQSHYNRELVLSCIFLLSDNVDLQGTYFILPLTLFIIKPPGENPLHLNVDENTFEMLKGNATLYTNNFMWSAESGFLAYLRTYISNTALISKSSSVLVEERERHVPEHDSDARRYAKVAQQMQQLDVAIKQFVIRSPFVNVIQKFVQKKSIRVPIFDEKTLVFQSPSFKKSFVQQYVQDLVLCTASFVVPNHCKKINESLSIGLAFRPDYDYATTERKAIAYLLENADTITNGNAVLSAYLRKSENYQNLSNLQWLTLLTSYLHPSHDNLIRLLNLEFFVPLPVRPVIPEVDYDEDDKDFLAQQEQLFPQIPDVFDNLSDDFEF